MKAGFKAILISFLLLIFNNFPVSAGEKSFKEEQQRYSRVRAARNEKEASIKEIFESKNILYPPEGIILIAYKTEHILELWADGGTGKYRIVKTYPICMLSGRLGPKRCEGDLQIPEGFYKIILFNPVSNFHLSMMINYPNKSDKILGCKKSGGLIFIHGNCVTIGCVPITDEMIKELYLICVDVKSAGKSEIPVYIFPSRLTAKTMSELENRYKKENDLIVFWKNIKTGYDIFEKTKQPLQYEVDKSGLYIFKR